MQNIFGPQNSQPGPFEAPAAKAPIFEAPQLRMSPMSNNTPMQEIDQGMFDPIARMNELYKPESAASDKYNQLINSVPEREKLGFWRGIASMLTDYKYGPQAGMNVANQPYNQKMEAWKAQVDPAYQAATLERQSNANNRQLAQAQVQSELGFRKQTETERKNRADEKIKQDRIDVYRLKATMPNYEFDFSGPTVMIKNPHTGEVKDSGIPTGSLSDADKLALQQQNAMEQIDRRGQIQSGLETQRQTGRENIAETRGWTAFNTADGTPMLLNQITGETKPVQGVNGPINRPGTQPNARNLLPNQVRDERYNRANELVTMYPEYAPYIRLGSSDSGDFQIADATTDTGGGLLSSFKKKGPTPEQRKLIMDYIYGRSDTLPAPPQTQTPTGNVNTNTQPIQRGPDGRPVSPNPNFIYIPNGQGGWRAVPKAYR